MVLQSLITPTAVFAVHFFDSFYIDFFFDVVKVIKIAMEIVAEDTSSFSMSLAGRDFFGQANVFGINLDMMYMSRPLSFFQFMVHRMEDGTGDSRVHNGYCAVR